MVIRRCWCYRVQIIVGQGGGAGGCADIGVCGGNSITALNDADLSARDVTGVEVDVVVLVLVVVLMLLVVVLLLI